MAAPKGKLVEVTNIPDDNVLTHDQQARVACLKAARSVLVATSVLSSAKADPTELISVAVFIETGDNPYSKTVARVNH